jgi:hypothetical protein
MITKKKTNILILESTIGRLNHTATACPLMCYYLNHVQHILEGWKKDNKPMKIERYLSRPALLNLKLWLDHILPKVHHGISINMITYRRPSIVCWSDACPKGMG